MSGKPYMLHGLGYYFFFKEKKEIPEAVEVMKFAIDMYPNRPVLWDALGEIYLFSGDKENAINNYKKALELDPKSESAQAALNKLEKK